MRVVPDVAQAFADLVVERQPRSIALSGGSTAVACYEALAARDIDWSQIEIFIGDERCVPIDDPDSNEGMIRRVLLEDGYGDSLHSLVGSSATPADAACSYESLLREHGPMDLIHLGLGPDGHTASLFPGASELLETERFVVVAGDDQHPHRRLTFTLPAISTARLVVFTVAGASKAAALATIAANVELVPASQVTAAEVIWLVDEAALNAA